MSDSDSTLPFTDEFKSRFLEIDEYEDSEPVMSEVPLPQFRILGSHFRPPSHTSSVGSKRRQHVAESASNNKRRPSRVTKHSATGQEQNEFKVDEQEEESWPFSSNNSRLTARQQSIKAAQRQEGPSHQSNPLPLTQLTPRPSPLTDEQLAEKERRVAERRALAKQKVEDEKRQTIERLLKIKSDIPSSINGSGAVKARANGRAKMFDVSSDQTGDTVEGQSSSDQPQPGFIRFISSSRLSPHSLISFDSSCIDPMASFASSSAKLIEPPKAPRSCSVCNCQPRRYACPRTGRSLCSLACYKQANLQPSTIQPTTAVL